VLVAVSVGLVTASERDIQRRPPDQVRGGARRSGAWPV
jgi:hypothetical protein